VLSILHVHLFATISTRMSTNSHTPPSSITAHDDAERGLADLVLNLPQRPPPAVAPLLSPALSSASTAVGSPVGTPPFSPKPSFISSAKTLAGTSDLRSTSKPEVATLSVVKAEPGTPAKPSAAPPRKTNFPRTLAFILWFNTYRKFFTFVVTFNLVCVLLAAVGRFDYATNHIGALVLGNLLCAILMRNELFGRMLYLIVNTLFAKVRT